MISAGINPNISPYDINGTITTLKNKASNNLYIIERVSSVTE